MKLTVTINGKPHTIELSGNEVLLDVLRDHGFYGVKRGCENGDCGSCAVVVDGRAMCSCLMMAGQVEGRQITTCEGLGDPVSPHPLQDSFVQCGAAQCGFCIPGMIVAAKELLDDHPDPSSDQMKEALDGNLCRCTGYTKQFEAVREAAVALRKEHPGPKSGPKGLARPAKAPPVALTREVTAARAVKPAAKRSAAAAKERVKTARKAAKAMAMSAGDRRAGTTKAVERVASKLRKAVKKAVKKALPRRASRPAAKPAASKARSKKGGRR